MDPSSITTDSESPMSIILENPLKVYFTGEMVRGRVRFLARENELVQLLSVYLRGEFSWKKGEQESTEEIFTESSPVDYRGAGEGNIEMDFCLVLRPNIPSSIVSSLGGVSYRVNSVLVFKEGSLEKGVEASVPISVNSRKQLPEDYSGRRCGGVERAGLFCCMGSITAEMDVSRVFLLCGRSALVNASVLNGTQAAVVSTAVLLVQIIQRQKDGKKLKRIVASKQRGDVLPGKRQVWLAEDFWVPPLPPTSADPFFKVSYKFVLEVHKSSGAKTKVKVPVVIGNLPAVEESSTNSLGSLHFDPASQVECKSSTFDGDPEAFRPLYVTYTS